MEFVTVEGIPIVGTGEYSCGSGIENFSAEDLADAVLASQDPTVTAPRIKLGHTDPRFAAAVAAGDLDGEPAFGTCTNLRLSDDGQQIIADLENVPSWLAESMPSSYPGRSIEGGRLFHAASGREYKLVITALALLGVTWPGVASLPDLQEVLDQNGEVAEPVAAGASPNQAERPFTARISRPGDDAPRETARPDVLAGMDLGSVRQQFVGDLDDNEVPPVPDGQPQADDVGPQMWWWPRSVRVEDDGTLCLIVDDDEGHLIRIPFTVEQADLVYGQPQLVIEQYIPVTADPDDGVQASGGRPRTLCSWSIRAASRPSTTTEVTTMDVDPAVLRTRLGLAEDADEAAITEALNAEPETVETDTTAAAPQVPEGMTLVDSETLETIRQGAEQGQQVAARMATEDRDRIIAAAIDEGRFPPSRRAHYETMWARDEEGTRTLLTASTADGGLAPGLVPTRSRELGAAGDGDGQPQAAAAEHEQFMARFYPSRPRGNTTTDRQVRVRQEA